MADAASSLCPASPEREEFGTFVCFTEKTRGGFISHLVKALKQAGLRTFTDELLLRGEAISDALTKRIKGSESTVIVISKDFAASHWCLDEVVESFRCKEEKVVKGHHIFPVFYKVDPSELRHLRGRTGHYLALHEERYGSNSDKIAWWRTCLVLLSDIAGWHLRSGGNESALIETIVEEVVTTLRMKDVVLIFNEKPPEEFDVFLCFTGKTRGGITSHLVKELKQAGVRTFTDDLLPRGEAISTSLFDHIKGSRSTIIVVSKDFAASDWCLDEVVESFRCKEEKVTGHYIFPVFYKVDPSELGHLRGRKGNNLALHDHKYGNNSDRVAWWRMCLVLLSYIAGWHFTSAGNEPELIQTIVEEVVKTLRMKDAALM